LPQKALWLSLIHQRHFWQSTVCKFQLSLSDASPKGQLGPDFDLQRRAEPHQIPADIWIEQAIGSSTAVILRTGSAIAPASPPAILTPLGA